MRHSLLLLCALYTPTGGVVLWPVTGKGNVTQALNSIDRGSWNKSAPFSNDTGSGILAVSSPALNATGQSLLNNSKSSLEEALWPPLETYNNFPDQCLLWDDQCTGNRTEALDLFFNNSGALYNVVYGAHCIWSREFECAPWLPSPEVLPKFLDWLRQPECVQSFYEYHTQNANQPAWTWSGRIFDGWSTYAIDWDTIATTTSSVGCCNQCTILGGDVDVYYWPVPGANSDCVSTIGSNFNNPVTELMVTDDRGYPYWKAQTDPWGQYGSQYVDSITVPPQQALAAGAPNPLSGPTNILLAREHWQNNITVAGNVSSSQAIATIGDFRCTSPSVCVGFSNIYAADACGALSTDGELVPYTIVAFPPRELSTIEIPAWIRASIPPKAAIRSFNFADLPCPPQSVMYAVEYKPSPGEPYRPVLSAPSRLSSLLPEWSKSGCVISAALFNGVDPPRALKAAEILTPRVTQVLPTASVAAVAAPASGLRVNEPSKTPKPSIVGDKEVSIPSDPDTSESGSEVSNPSSSDPKQTDPKKADPKAVEFKNSDIDAPKSNDADPQNTRLSISKPENTPADASNPKPPNTENLDPKHANSPPSDSQKIDSGSVNDQNESEEAQGSSAEVSKSDDTKASSSSPDGSQRIVPGTPPNVAESSNGNSENAALSDYTSSVSDSNGNDDSGRDSQGEEVADPDTKNLDSFEGESKQAASNRNNAALSQSNNSPAADPEANSDDDAGAQATGDGLDLFDVLPTKLFNVNEALSPSAKSGSGQYSTQNDPQRDPSSQPENNMETSPAGENLDDDDGTARNALSFQYSAYALPTAGSDAMAGPPKNTTPADDTTFSPQNSPNDLPVVDPDAMKDPPSKTALADDSVSSPQNSANDLPTTGSAAVGDPSSKTASTNDSASAIAAAGISKKSGSALPSASVAASVLGVGSDGTSDSKSQGNDVDAAVSSKAKSSGSSLLASRRNTESHVLISAQGLVYGFGIYVLPWLLILL